ncbi:Ras family gtpase, partial [Globisporangium splendens]
MADAKGDALVEELGEPDVEVHHLVGRLGRGQVQARGALHDERILATAGMYHVNARVQFSTFALTMFRKEVELEDDEGKDKKVAKVDMSGILAFGFELNGLKQRIKRTVSLNGVGTDFWGTADQERFSSMHPSYYYGATVYILVLYSTEPPFVACWRCRSRHGVLTIGVTGQVFNVTQKVTYQNLANWYKELREYCENIPCFLVANKIDVDMAVTGKKFKFAETHNLEFSFVSAADGTNVVKVFKDAAKAAMKFKKEGGDFMADVLDLLGEESTLSSFYLEMTRFC